MFDLKKYNNNVALVDDNNLQVTYAEIEKIGYEIATVMGERCVVVVLAENSIASVVGYIAFMNHKYVPMMLNANLEIRLRDNLVDNYKPKFIWAPKACIEENEIAGYQVVYELYHYVLLKSKEMPKYELYSELALLLTTSGSTGSPKFVRQSYTNVLENAKSIVEYLKLDETERPITTLPMNYTYGLSIINSHILVGATILVTKKGLMEKAFWDFMKDQRATSFGGVPYTYEMLHRLRFYRMDLKDLRYMTQAGGKITPELHAKFAEYAQEHHKKFIVMYGQCEATARMGYLPANKSLEKCGSMGIAIPGGTFRLIDEQGDLIDEVRKTGELVYEGKNVTLGYAECLEDLAKGDERNGILYTGDMAQVDEDGYYYIVGRKKRFLKIFGNRVNLDEVDRLIKAEFDNIEVASAGVDDHMYIFIENAELSNRVKQFIINKTKLNSSAFKVVVIDEIPKNDSGKTLYKELKKYY